MKRITVALFLLFYSAGSASQPLYSYAQSPIHSNILSLKLREAKPQPTGTIELKSGVTQASIWAETNDYFFDYYQNSIDLAVSYQVNQRWKSEVAFKRIKARDNGLDELTKNFHDLFGIGHNGRDTVPQDQFYLSIPNKNIEITDFEGETLTKAIISYNELSIYQNNPLSISIGATFYYNDVNSGPFSRSSFEQGLQLNSSYTSQDHHVFSSFGIVHRNSDIPESLMTNSAGFISLGYEYLFLANHSVLLESHNYEGWATTNPSFSELSNEVLLGYRYQHLNYYLEAYMTENIRNMDNSTDIAFTLNFRMIL